MRKSAFPTYIRFYYPIIVFDGKLYECTIEGEEPNLNEINHVLVHYWHRDGLFYYDIVKKEYFEDFIKKINKEKDRIINTIDENYSQIMETGEKIKEAIRRQTKKG